MRILSPLLGLTAAVVVVAITSTVIQHGRAQTADPCAALASAVLSGARVESAHSDTTGTVAGAKKTN